MDLTGKRVTITRPSASNGQPFTREVLVSKMANYRGIEQGTAVHLAQYPFFELLSPAEVATAH